MKFDLIDFADSAHAQQFQDQPQCFKKDDVLLPFYRFYSMKGSRKFY